MAGPRGTATGNQSFARGTDNDDGGLYAELNPTGWIDNPASLASGERKPACGELPAMLSALPASSKIIAPRDIAHARPPRRRAPGSAHNGSLRMRVKAKLSPSAFRPK